MRFSAKPGLFKCIEIMASSWKDSSGSSGPVPSLHRWGSESQRREENLSGVTLIAAELWLTTSYCAVQGTFCLSSPRGVLLSPFD